LQKTVAFVGRHNQGIGQELGNLARWPAFVSFDLLDRFGRATDLFGEFLPC
jgi:hypothetical protein